MSRSNKTAKHNKDDKELEKEAHTAMKAAGLELDWRDRLFHIIGVIVKIAVLWFARNDIVIFAVVVAAVHWVSIHIDWPKLR